MDLRIKFVAKVSKSLCFSEKENKEYQYKLNNRKLAKKNTDFLCDCKATLGNLKWVVLTAYMTRYKEGY